jgi:hypothetical protein
MHNFEDIKPGTRLLGLDPSGIAEVVQVARFGPDAVNLVFRVDGRVGERLVYWHVGEHEVYHFWSCENCGHSWLADARPRAYLALLGRIMPMQVERATKEVDVPYKTVEELQQALRDRGLPVERIYPLLEFEPLTQDVANEDGQ